MLASQSVKQVPHWDEGTSGCAMDFAENGGLARPRITAESKHGAEGQEAQ